MKRATGTIVPLPLLWGGMLAIAACADDSATAAAVKALGEGCLIDSECTGDLVCVFRRCHVECEIIKDCRDAGLDTICVIGDRPTNVCLLGDEQTCTVTDEPGQPAIFKHSECPSDGMVCGRDGKCRDRCQSDGECLPQQTCLKGSCADENEEPITGDSPLVNDEPAGPSATCRYHSQCIEPLVCRFGLCENECLADVDCPADRSLCVAVPDSVVPDAKKCVSAQPDPREPAHCGDGIRSGNESGIDCGGSCHLCPPGQLCSDGDDCESGVCETTCLPPTCSDGVRNGLEIDIDCGGNCPLPCATCTQPSDCGPGETCDTATGVCEAATCSDGVQNNGETAADCGGPNCSPCDPLLGCVIPGDCSSGVCIGSICQLSTCTDGVRNNTDESDIDCGGVISGCAPCGDGADCQLDGDCQSSKCTSLACSSPSCADGVQNGFELGVDCGGGCPAGCPVGTPCFGDDDCDQAAPAGCHPGNQTCTAKYQLTVTLTGAGTGAVTAAPAGLIDCPADCSEELFDGESVTLTGTPGANSVLNGFTGACIGPNPCHITISGADAAVSVDFSPGAAGLANWQALPILSAGDLRAVAFDHSGHLLVGGSATSGGEAGCATIGAANYDGVIVKYAPGLPWDGGSCVSQIVDGGAGNQYVRALAVDSQDDVVAVYEAWQEPTFNGMATLPCPGNGSRLALAKYDGSLQQTASWGICHGAYTTVGDAVIDLNDDVVVVGHYDYNGDDFGGGPLTCPTTDNMLIVKYDGATGGHVRSRCFSGTGSGAIGFSSIDMDATGHFVVAGSCAGAPVFEPGTVEGNNDGAGSLDACIVKFDSGLTAQWVYQVGSNVVDGAVDAAFLPNGDVVAALHFATQIYFGAQQHNAVGGDDIAVVRLDGTTGALLEAVSYGTASADRPGAIAADPSGAIYLAGMFQIDGLDVGGGARAGSVFLAKYSSFGVWEWDNATGDTGHVGSGWTGIGMLALSPTGAPALIGQGDGTYDWGAGPNTSIRPWVNVFNP